MARYPITWDGKYNGNKTTTIVWSNNQYTWDDVAIIVKAKQKKYGGRDDGLSRLQKEDKKKCIRLIMKWRGIEVYDEEKCVKKIKTYAKDVDMIYEEMKSLNLIIENVSV